MTTDTKLESAVDEAKAPEKKPEHHEHNTAMVDVGAKEDINKKATDLFREAKRFTSLGELPLAMENIDLAISLETVDNAEYNKADAYFLAAQLCRRMNEFKHALDYIEKGIRCVNPYRKDSPKFALSKGVIQLQMAEVEHETAVKKLLAGAIESFKMAVTVAEVLLGKKKDHCFEPQDLLVVKKYHMISIFDLAYAHDLSGDRRSSIEVLDRLFELYPHIHVGSTTFELFDKIQQEKAVSHTAK